MDRGTSFLEPLLSPTDDSSTFREFVRSGQDGAGYQSDPEDRQGEVVHPSFGVCRPGCLSWGQCHCGCGRTPSLCNTTNSAENLIKGNPHVWVSGHNPKGFKGAYSVSGVRIEPVRKILRWLQQRYGSWDRVAEVIGVPYGTINTIIYDQRKPNRRVSPDVAQKVLEVFQAHPRHRQDPYSLYESQESPRLATKAEREQRDEEVALLAKEKRKWGY